MQKDTDDFWQEYIDDLPPIKMTATDLTHLDNLIQSSEKYPYMSISADIGKISRSKNSIKEFLNTSSFPERIDNLRLMYVGENNSVVSLNFGYSNSISVKNKNTSLGVGIYNNLLGFIKTKRRWYPNAKLLTYVISGSMGFYVPILINLWKDQNQLMFIILLFLFIISTLILKFIFDYKVFLNYELFLVDKKDKLSKSDIIGIASVISTLLTAIVGIITLLK